MDTGFYLKSKNKKWRAFRPVCYTFWGVRNPAEYRENKCGSKIKNNKMAGRPAVYFIFVGESELKNFHMY